MDLSGKKVLVIGSGISGIGSVRILEKVGAVPILFDENDCLSMEKIRERLPERSICAIFLGELPEEEEREIKLVVLSPGVPVDLPFLTKLRKMNIPVIGEIELAYVYAKGALLAVTGTNGKTTTTALLGRIMKDYFSHVFIVGNIGNPYTDIALETTENSVTVAEISSFQLETIDSFHPRVSAILNITPDHLNRHHTMECYVSTKEAIARNQGEKDTIVLNYDDSYTRDFGTRTTANVLYFSRKEKLTKGVYLDQDNIIYADGKENHKVIAVNEMQLLGGHNVENVMAAAGMAISFGVPITNICDTIKKFKAVEHRIEFVREVNGVAYYNDSKGTNVDAAIKGIQAMTRKTILIGGGYDKQSDYDEWIRSFDGKVKYLILLGQTAEEIAVCAKKNGFLNVIFVKDLKEAVDVAKAKAEKGDAVLLSPACASWGMFKNYEERGCMFKSFVNRL